MTCLPIVARELRVAARRGRTRWTRFTLTALGALITMNYFVVSASASPSAFGRSAFLWLCSASFALACAACLLTADTLSGEHREGTLGFLFLTDLRARDITLGKLASAGLGAVYVGLSFLPLLAVPLLHGGVGWTEAVRTGLALLAMLLFALAAGLAASARETARGRALGRAAIWVAAVVLLPAVATWLGMGGRLLPIGLLSPLVTLQLALEPAYRAAPAHFWVSFALQLLHAAWLLWRAGVGLRTSWIKPFDWTPPPPPEPIEQPVYSADPFSNASYLAANPSLPPRERPRRSFEGARPLEWYVRRQRGRQALCWTAAFLIAASQFYVLPNLNPLAPAGATMPLIWYSLSQLWWVGEALLAWAICRFFFEARRTGELELLLTSPVGAQGLIPAHWAALKQLLLPVTLVLLPLLALGGYSTPPGPGGLNKAFTAYQIYSRLYALLRPVELLLLLLALNWLGALFGLTARRLLNAVGLTLALVVGPRLAVHLLFGLVIRPFLDADPGSAKWVFWPLTYYAVDYALLLALVVWARRQFRQGTPGDPLRLGCSAP
jgi:hypothetical protein